MIIKKITPGFVIQNFDSKTEELLSQEFIAGNEDICYEDSVGNSVEENDLYAPFNMEQPNTTPIIEEILRDDIEKFEGFKRQCL